MTELWGTLNAPTVLSMRLALCPSLVLTDDSTAALYGTPVLINSDRTADQETYRADDLLQFAGQVMPAAHWARLLGELKKDPKERELIDRFLRSWPEGPQLGDVGKSATS